MVCALASLARRLISRPVADQPTGGNRQRSTARWTVPSPAGVPTLLRHASRIDEVFSLRLRPLLRECKHDTAGDVGSACPGGVRGRGDVECHSAYFELPPEEVIDRSIDATTEAGCKRATGPIKARGRLREISDTDSGR